jgi:hypothetical protein
MNDKTNPEKFRKLSIAALITGILAICLASIYLFLNLSLVSIRLFNIDSFIWDIYFIIGYLVFVAFCLSITAIVCGSVDLGIIKRSYGRNRGKGFNIVGIVLGVIAILFYIFGNYLI